MLSTTKMFNRVKKTLLFLTLIGLLALTYGPMTTYAQETETANNESAGNEPLIMSPEIVEIDAEKTPENIITPELLETAEIGAQDLEISEPRLLPTSRFYFLKNFWRGARLFIARSPEKKAELKLKYANEKLIELKKIAELTDVKQEIIENHLESYQNDLEEANKKSEEIEDKKAEVKEKFREKYLQHNLKHQLILQKLANQVPPQAYEIIQQNRERHLERFKNVMEKVAEKQDVKGKIEETLEETAKTRPLIRLRAVEILKDLKEIAPESLKLKIQNIEEENLNVAAKIIKKLDPKKRKEIIEKEFNSIANPVIAAEIAEEVAKSDSALKSTMEEIKTKPLENLILNRFQSLEEEKRERILEKMIKQKTDRVQILEKVQTRLKNTSESKTNQVEVQEQVQTKLKSSQAESSQELTKEQKREQEQKQISPEKEIQPSKPTTEKPTYQPTELLKRIIDREKTQARIQPIKKPQSTDSSGSTRTK